MAGTVSRATPLMGPEIQHPLVPQIATDPTNVSTVLNPPPTPRDPALAFEAGHIVVHQTLAIRNEGGPDAMACRPAW